MLHLIGNKEPNIKLSIDSNASIAGNTIDPLKVFQFHHIQCQLSKQRRIKSNDTNRATFKRPNTMATLRNKSTKLTVARAPKYDKKNSKIAHQSHPRTSPCQTASTTKATRCQAHMSASRSTRAIGGHHIYRNKVATT
jgi:hypothetical protein